MAPRRPRLAFASIPLAAAVLLAGVASAQVELVPVTTLPLDVPLNWYPSSSEFAVAAGGDGRALAVWTEVDSGGSPPNRKHTISSRVFDPLGATFGPILRPVMKGYWPELAASAAFGRYLVPWAFGPYQTNQQLLGRILDANGNALTATSLLAEFRKDYGVIAVAAAGGDGGHILAWANRDETVHARRVAIDGSTGVDIAVDSLFGTKKLEVANTPDGGFVVAYGSYADTVRVRAFTAAGNAKSAGIDLSPFGRDELMAVAASPVEDVVAVLIHHEPLSPPDSLIVQRLTSGGDLVGTPITVAEVGGFVAADLAYDRNGDLYVVWVDSGSPLHARAYFQDGTPIGAEWVGTIPMGSSVATARLANGDFVNLCRVGSFMEYNVVSLCAPGSSVCGDGVFNPLCEGCDAGAGNSDVAPDACRTNCEPARCGDGTIDGGEACDDGNTADCDGCSAACTVEAGLGCGDGIAFPTCGESCDDGNTIAGDGCSACALERAFGGGNPSSDCFTAWSVDNPANQPRYDKSGAISAEQVCTDGDPRCDFDGGTPGSCTFHVRVCVNNTAIASCTPGTRIASWELRLPSESRAATRPALAAVRSAFLSVVPGSVVGTSQVDACSPTVEVPIALHGSAGSYGNGRLTLKTRAVLYDGRNDSDKLRLECRPAP